MTVCTSCSIRDFDLDVIFPFQDVLELFRVSGGLVELVGEEN